MSVESRSKTRSRGISYDPDIHNREISGTLDLGLYFSPRKNETQVAKVPQADRATHTYVVGATGTGKTRFLQFLIWQDVMSGHGFGIVDPHGDLVEDVKGLLAGHYWLDDDVESITNRVVIVDPTDPKYTVTFNPLERVHGVSVAEQAGELVSSFRKIWSDWGSRMEDLMRNSLIALGEAELTLCELPPFLTRRQFRQVVMESVENPTAIDYFRRFDTLTDRSQITWIEPVMNKMNALLADERMRQMFSSTKSSFHLREIMDEGKHLLVKLDKGKLKGGSDLLGSLLMARIQMTAFSRSDVPANKRVPFYLYIDEFQNFATDTFETVLSEARKYGLSLIMAHQSLSQIPDSLRGLILSSAGLQVFFRVNRSDASLLAKEVFQSSGSGVRSDGWERKIAALQQLPPRTCYVKHKIQGGAIRLSTVHVPAPSECLQMSQEDCVEYMSTIPFGHNYLGSRADLALRTSERQETIESKMRQEPDAVIEPTPTTAPILPAAVVERRTPQELASIYKVIEVAQAPQTEPVVEREHRRLQHLIKRLAEQGGYKAVLEQPTDDGQGRVDVSLVRDDRSIACEVSVTTSPEHELGNIRKCLSSGYDRVILCSPERKALEKTRALCLGELPESDMDKLLFFEPDELILCLEEDAAKNAGKIERIKGYRVKVNYQPLQEADKATKRQAIAQVLLQSLRREKR